MSVNSGIYECAGIDQSCWFCFCFCFVLFFFFLYFLIFVSYWFVFNNINMTEWVDDDAHESFIFGKISNKVSNPHYCNWIDTFVYLKCICSKRFFFLFNSIRNKKNYESVVCVFFHLLFWIEFTINFFLVFFFRSFKTKKITSFELLYF